jgi:hypothetical protein
MGWLKKLTQRDLDARIDAAEETWREEQRNNWNRPLGGRRDCPACSGAGSCAYCENRDD